MALGFNAGASGGDIWQGKAGPWLTSLLVVCFTANVALTETIHQRSCHFTHAKMSDGRTSPVDHQATVVVGAGSARVEFPGGISFEGRAVQADGVVEITFRTDVSTEVMTIQDTGETEWDILHDDGRKGTGYYNFVLTGYSGTCVGSEGIS